MAISALGIMPGYTCGFDSYNAIPPPAPPQQPLCWCRLKQIGLNQAWSPVLTVPPAGCALKLHDPVFSKSETCWFYIFFYMKVPQRCAGRSGGLSSHRMGSSNILNSNPVVSDWWSETEDNKTRRIFNLTVHLNHYSYFTLNTDSNVYHL